MNLCETTLAPCIPRARRVFAALATSCVLASCVVNPVTGNRELALVSAEQELAIGTAQYAPSRQMQGGDLVIDPALQAYVRSVGQRLADVSDRALPYEFVVLNSSVPNAWALPGGKIAINRGLLTELGSEAELAAVLAHEIVHAAARHGALAMQRGMLLQTVLVATAATTGRGDYSGLAVGAAGVGAQLINQRNGREAELESDRYGMIYMSRAGYDPAAAITLQQTFVRLSENRADPSWLAGLFASHPPSVERVTRNRATATELPAGGDLGVDRFDAALATLRRTAPAYDAYDAGRRALNNREFSTAEARALEAVQAVPNEAHFHALLGDIDYAQERYADAAQHFADAVGRNAEYFYYHLRLGMTEQRLQRWDSAETSFTRSLDLLPTADGHLGLGMLAERRGDTVAALESYRLAAQSSGAAGTAAKAAVVRLDLPQNPGQYIALRTALDANAMLYLEIGNPTALTVADIGITIAYTDAQGVRRQINRVLNDTVAANETRQIATGLGPFRPPATYAVTIVDARVVAD